MNSEIIDITTICDTFPKTPEPEIDRGNVLDGIDRVFGGSATMVIVEGDGLGKTNILAKFALRHSNQSAALFVNTSSRWGCDIEYLRRDLANQLNWILTKEELGPEDVPDDVFLRKAFTEIHRINRRRNKNFYFIVDGIDELPPDFAVVQQSVINILPWGLHQFKFLLSGDSIRMTNLLPKNITIKPFPLAPFSQDETRRYFSNTNLSPANVDCIYRIWRGLPSHLASIRRLVQFGDVEPDKLFEQLPSHLPGLFELEWKKADLSDSLTSSVLAILAHDRGDHTISRLARLLNCSDDKIVSRVDDLSFVLIDDSSGKIAFVSEAFRSFAVSHLDDKRREVANLFVDAIFQQSDDLTSFNNLSRYLEETGRFSELLNYISPEYLRGKLESSQSLQIVKYTAALGLQAAQRLHRDDALIRFGMQQSALNEVGIAASWRSEVMARTAVGDFESALSLAQRTVLQEDRLHLLAVIARVKRQQKLVVEQELSNQIKFLYSQIEWREVNDQAVDIAADLLYTHPDLAINLLEQTGRPRSGDQTLDWAFASLYLKAEAVSNEFDDFVRLHELVSSKIKDPVAKTFSSSMSEYVKDYSAEQVIAEAQKLDRPVEAVYLLRRWAVANKRKQNAVKVVDFALNLIIRTTPYSPNARDFQEIASPLPFVPDKNIALELVRSFDSQKGVISTVGPTEDFVLLTLILAETEFRWDFNNGRHRFVEIYYYILGIVDIYIKANCTAHLLSSITRVDPRHELETLDKLHSSTEGDLRLYVAQLLEATSDHYDVTQRIIAALSLEKSDLAHEFAMQLNVEPRRNAALRDIITNIISDGVTKNRLVQARNLLSNIKDAGLRDEVVDAILNEASLDNELDEEAFKALLPVIHACGDILDVEVKCRAYCHVIIVAKKVLATDWEDLRNSTIDKIETTWNQIDIAWQRIEIGFKMAEKLAQVLPDYAQRLIQLTDAFRKNVLFESEWAASSYNFSVSLSLRAYSGLLLRRHDTAEHLAAINNLIEQISSLGEQAILWSELALYYAQNKRTDDAKKIVSQHIRPLLERLRQVKDNHYFNVLVSAAPALFVAHSVTAFEILKDLPISEQDRACWGICRYIMLKRSPSDPYEYWMLQNSNVSYEDIVDVCAVADRISTDVHIYQIIEWITDVLLARSSRTKYSHQQKSDLIRRLKDLVGAKLPNPRFIKHEGWKVAALAKIERVNKYNNDDWKKIIDQARTIPNKSDRSLVLGMVTASMPLKDSHLRDRLFEEVTQEIEQMPDVTDKINQYKSMAYLNSANPTLYSKYLRRAMSIASEKKLLDRIEYQRQIIDLAYRFDRDLASSLASLSDDDPARNILKQQLDTLKAVEDIASQSTPTTIMDSGEFPDIAWRLLGKLNANRINALHVDKTRLYIEQAASLPMHEAYPILSWVIQNAVVRHANTEQALTLLRPIFEATLLGAELTARVAVRSAIDSKRLRDVRFVETGLTQNVFGAGERQAALSFLRSWFEQHLGDTLKICDQYFGPEDLDLLKLVLSVKPDCRVLVLSGQKHHNDLRISNPAESYRVHWRSISDQEPPETEIVIVGRAASKKSPIHDRWWITNGFGINVGTSFNSLGITQESIIMPLSEEKTIQCEQELDQYLFRQKRDYSGERLEYTITILT